jgi:hypothetical protein
MTSRISPTFSGGRTLPSTKTSVGSNMILTIRLGLYNGSANTDLAIDRLGILFKTV